MSNADNTGSDPFTSSVIQASLVAAADEMFAVLRQTAMSPIIYEVLDVGTGSGVLALSALRLGAGRATGFDLDAVAVPEAHTRARRRPCPLLRS